jgi:hypothetical protein
VGVGFGIAVGVGGTIGSGILRTPGEVAAHCEVRGSSSRFGCWVEFTHFSAPLPSLSLPPCFRLHPHVMGPPSTSIFESAKASLNDIQQAQRLRQGFQTYTTVTIGTSETIDRGAERDGRLTFSRN